MARRNNQNNQANNALKERNDKMRSVFEKSYSDYKTFKENVLDNVFTQYRYEKLSEDFTKRDEFQKFFAKQPIEHFYEKGKYKIENNKELYIYEVVIKDSVKIHHARVGIQSLLRQATFLRTGQSALMIFRYAKPENRSWRLSYMAKTGDIEGNVHYTAAKRYTYIFGPDCHVRTAVERFATIAGKPIKIDDLTAAFSVEAVTKEFYTKLFDWYEWALGLDKKKYPDYKFNVTFPNDPDTSGDDREESSLRQHLIRLITRLIFVWFIKQKGLVANELFDTAELRKILKDFDPLAGENGDGCKPQTEATTNYYHAILQNLFFATLNKAMNERTFAYEGNDKAKRAEHYTVKTFYRYGQDLTENGKEKLLKLFEKTPFLNGGLFECLDTVRDEKKEGEHSALHRDGFSRDDKMNGNNFAYRAFIPNILFFNEDERHLGLINLLKQYNFTVEENTPDEEQVALDPELLGKIFENLLASYNPETAETAQKSTGSYYTPREIVHYMAEQSIAECLKAKLKKKFCSGKRRVMEPEVLEQAIDELMQGDECPEALTLARTDIETALFDMKILDPACGSGAFPMGVMQCMLGLLAKIKNSETFDKNQHEYKLKIIQNCLYGVDIQPIAVQISKLRCFITLIVDESPVDSEPNRGITLLPNLETKFVCANSLIPLEVSLNEDEPLFKRVLQDVNKAKRELQEIRAKHFGATSYAQKISLRKDDEAKRNELRKLYEEAKVSSAEIDKLLSWNPYDQTVSNSFFDPEWMLGVKDGFDVVIGNPPYIDSETMTANMPEDRRIYQGLYRCAVGNWDYFVLFIEKAIKLSKNEAFTTLIVPNKLLSAPYSEEVRKYLTEYSLKYIRDYSKIKVFIDVDVYPIVFGIKKTTQRSSVIMELMKTIDETREHNVIKSSEFYSSLEWDKFFTYSCVSIVNKLNGYTKFRNIKNVNIKGAATVRESYLIKEALLDSKELSSSSQYIQIINTGLIDPYESLYGIYPMQYLRGQYLYPVINRDELININKTRFDESQAVKIIIAGMSKRLECYYDTGCMLAGKSTIIVYGCRHLKYITALLNSKLLTYYYTMNNRSASLNGGYFNITKQKISDLPILFAKDEIINEIEVIVDQLLVIKNNSHEHEADVSALNMLIKQIDDYVYNIYSITNDEINVIEQEIVDY